jgi:hypothetical protein
MIMFRYGSRVLIGPKKVPGTIRGGGWFQREGSELTQAFIVELETGFFAPNDETYISLVLVHPDSLHLDPGHA